jgi:hypothetical protein
VELAHMTLDGQSSPWLHPGIGGGNSRRLRLHHLTIRNLARVKTWGPHAILFYDQQRQSLEANLRPNKDISL